MHYNWIEIWGIDGDTCKGYTGQPQIMNEMFKSYFYRQKTTLKDL